jgi:hypothetical protein
MPDWKPLLTARLAKLRLRPSREGEIVDELSQHLDDRYHELRASGTAHHQAMRLAIDEIEDEGLLARAGLRGRDFNAQDSETGRSSPSSASRWFVGSSREKIH